MIIMETQKNMGLVTLIRNVVGVIVSVFVIGSLVHYLLIPGLMMLLSSFR